MFGARLMPILAELKITRPAGSGRGSQHHRQPESFTLRITASAAP
jgi:hypothetical protein